MKTLILLSSVVAFVLASLPSPAGADAPANRYTFPVGGATTYDTKTKLTWQRTAPAQGMMWADAATYCASADVTTLLGGTGWRVPTIKELQTLVDYAHATGTLPIDATAFPSAPGGVFWSSTLAAGATTIAWAVSFSTGGAVLGGVAATARVRCVR